MEDEPQKDCPTPKSRGEAIWVSLDRLVPDPALPPIVVSEGTIKLVAARMESAGQIDPLRARPGADPDAPFRVVDGRVRLAVLEMLGWAHALITVDEPLDDREVLYRTAVRSAGGRPHSPLEMAWITFHMVEEETAAGSDAPQRVVARRLRSDLGSGSEPTVSRRIKITRRISPEWLASVGIDPADLIDLSQRALGKVAELEDRDARAHALRLKAGLTDETGEPCANASPRLTVRSPSAGLLHLSMREGLGQHWSREELRTLVDAIEPLLEQAQNLLVGDASVTDTAGKPSKCEHPDLLAPDLLASVTGALVSVTGALVASLAREEALRSESARRGRGNLRGCLRRALSTARTTAGRLLRAFAHHAARFHRG